MFRQQLRGLSMILFVLFLFIHFYLPIVISVISKFRTTDSTINWNTEIANWKITFKVNKGYRFVHEIRFRDNSRPKRKTISFY